MDRDDGRNGAEIAVIGMVCRFPGARDVEQFWDNLCSGRETIARFGPGEVEPSVLDPDIAVHEDFVAAAPVLDEVDLFDADFFEYSPKEAQIMDPQQRLFLECSWEALEAAGYDPATYPGLIGVFAGASTDRYVFNLFSNRTGVGGGFDSFQVGLGNDLAFLANRVSYKLDLRGPSLAVHTACSTALVAIHLARQSLLLDECQIALAGGVSVQLPERGGYLYRQGGPLSPDGHCRPFDARGQGTLFGSGVGVVVLKRLEDALADGDRILGVTLGSAVNNDGGHKASFTAPSVQGQTEVILEALADAGVDPNTLGYVEAHGTGTNLGDPVEVRALTRAFRAHTDRRGFCALGSVKCNLGHLDSAAAMPGLFKALLAVRHGKVPGTLHFTEPNPQIDFDDSPFFVPSELVDWPEGAAPRRAAVSSFGVGGTNAHLILEEPPPTPPGAPAEPWQLLVLSARSPTALNAATDRLADHLERHHDAILADVAFTLATGRKAFGHRRTVVARDVADAIARLRDLDPQQVASAHCQSGRPGVVFLFPGGGTQYVGMGRDLYETDAVFRRHLDRCADLLRPRLDLDVREALYPGETPSAPEVDLEATWLALPALFSVEYALAQVWIERGFEPEAMIGHSLGEYVAACLAGVMGLEDALELVVARGRLMGTLPPGSMLGVPLAADAVRPLLGDQLDLAADNAPDQCVVSGPAAAVEDLANRLDEQGVETRRLHIGVAAHSRLVEPILEEFEGIVRRIRLEPPERPYVSNVTGTWIRPEEATDPAYWARHLRRTVRFCEGIAEILDAPDRLLLEVGPSKALTTLAKAQAAGRGAPVEALPSMRHPSDRRSDRAFLLGTIGKLWLAGAQVDWEMLFAPGSRRRVELPTYPFERKRHWIDAVPGSTPAAAAEPTGKRDLADWFYIPAWQPTRPPAAGELPLRWLVLADRGGIGERATEELRSQGRQVVVVHPGEAFERGEDGVRLPPADPDAYEALVRDLAARELLPEAVLHLWTLDLAGGDGGREAFAPAQERGYYSLLFLTRALERTPEERPPAHLVVASRRLQDVSGAEDVSPETAPLLGLVKVVSQEAENVRCTSVDLEPGCGQAAASHLARRLIAEAAVPQPVERVVAYRGVRRWVQRFEPIRLDEAAVAERRLRDRGVYLITGGLGGVGMHLGAYLARVHRARLVLVGRSRFPPRERWDELVEDDAADPADRDRIRRLLEWEGEGAEVLVAQADVADRDAMEGVLASALERFGGLDGVLHAAGVTSGPSLYRPFFEMGAAESETQFGPKVHGTYVLADLLEGRTLDFCLLFSSNAAVLGGLGQSVYAAANAFLDAFAAQRSRRGETPWISANWDAWPEFTRKYTHVQTSMDQYTMTPEESAEAFRRLATLASAGQVAVPTGDMEARFSLWIRREAGAEGPGARQGRPALATEYEAPRGATEERLAEIWCELLGLEEIGARDNFFDLGGHSLLATRLVGRVRESFRVELQLGAFFEAPTIRGLAEAVERLLADRADEEDVLRRDILEMLEGLSEEDVEAEFEQHAASLDRAEE